MANKPGLHAGMIRPLFRMCIYIYAGLRFLSGNIIDGLLRRGSQSRRADRLRRILESLGPTFVKLGQQLSLRADILPYAYCQAFAELLDNVRPFATSKAIQILELSLKRQKDDIFEYFNPEPIGSASLACVFQARLKSGEEVAVKVRRPKVADILISDLTAFGWLIRMAEWFTVLEPGLANSVQVELQTMLLAELDFRREARFMDMFRRDAIRKSMDVTAPRVYFEWCSEDILVSEFVKGIQMSTLLKAVDHNDQAMLEKARSNGIEPKVLAQRLARVVHIQLMENLFFHADPHPANLFVLPNNTICFLDFGSCGRFTTRSRRIWRQLHFHILRRDVSRMVQSAISLAEPLPPVDADRFRKRLEQIFTDWIYASVSKDAEWWERCTAQNWIKYVAVARELAIPVNLETLQFFRATMLYDTLIVRLDPKFDFPKEFRKYIVEAGNRSRKRVMKWLRKRFNGPIAQDWTMVEEVADFGTQAFARLRKIVDAPLIQFAQLIGKAAFVALTFARVAILGVGGLALTGAWAIGSRCITGEDPVMLDVVTLSPPRALALLAFSAGAVIFLRKLMARIDDVKVDALKPA